MKKASVFLSLCISLFVLSGWAFALPSEPPPQGKVWVEVGGKWLLVIEPPGKGPYKYKNGSWIIDQSPQPPESDWVPAHWIEGHWVGNKWIPGKWVPGHWRRISELQPGTHWIPGHWKGNIWVPGQWGGTPPPGKQWVPGQLGPQGGWIPGHWK